MQLNFSQIKTNYILDQGFANYGSQLHLGSRNIVLGRETNWLDKPDANVFVN